LVILPVTERANMKLHSSLLLLLLSNRVLASKAQIRGRHNRFLQTSTIFPVDVSDSICPGLVQKDKNTAEDATACASLCENDAGCDLWQYCPESKGSCPLPGEDQWTPGNWARCYVSVAEGSRDGCLPDHTNKWIGGARSDSTRVPTKTAEPVSVKRGFSGYLNVDVGETEPLLAPVCADAEALGREDSWYYTWMTRTSSVNHCRHTEKLWGAGPNGPGSSGTKMGGEFVPMVIGVGEAAKVLQDIDRIKREWTRSNAHFLLGYNEPDPAPNHPHSVEAAIAAEDWPLVQQVALSFDPPLTLVSPAPASEDFDEDGRSEWLDDFLGNCTYVVADCDPSLIEYVAFHDYKGDVDLLERRINGMAAHYGRPLWLTEYSIGRWMPSPLRPEQDAYMKESLTLLENHPDIYRYVWFNSRSDPSQWGGVKDLVAWNSSEPILTSTGEIYKTWPEGPSPSPTAAPTPSPEPIYEPADHPGLYLILSDAGESCTSACSRSSMTCTEIALAAAEPYGLTSTIEQTAQQLGIICSKNNGERTGIAFPQIRPDKDLCYGKTAGTNYNCDASSTWNIAGQRICSCIASGLSGDSCTNSYQCVSGECNGSGICA